MSVLVKETVTGLQHGHVAVTTTRKKIFSDPLPSKLNKGVLLRCPGVDDPVTNTIPVWVGGPAVTADSDATTGGYPMAPGDAITVPIEVLTELYAISSGSADLAWLAL